MSSGSKSTIGAKSNNHEITRGYLTNWAAGPRGNATGIWYIDVNTNEIQFSRGKKASFAVTPWLYVPKMSTGIRDDRLENWFAEYENDLCQLARFSQFGPPSRATTRKFDEKAIKGCITLGHRSSYEITQISNILRQNNPTLTDDELKFATLQNIYSLINSQFREFESWFFVINYNLPINLFTSDRPFVNFDLRDPSTPVVSMALAPRCMLTGLPNASGKSNYRLNWFDGALNKRMCEMYNQFQLNMARQWVVCTSKEEAELIRPGFTPEEVAKRTALDAARYRSGSNRRLFP